MITTSEIAPSPKLAPFVRCYSIREFDTMGMDMHKPFHAQHEITMVFFFQSKPVHLIDSRTNHIIKKGDYADVLGLGTHYNGQMVFNGSYSFFEICFKPTGFHKIFGLPLLEITNHIILMEDILDITVHSFYQHLCDANGIAEMGAIADTYLLERLKKQKTVDSNNAITFISNSILKHSEYIKVGAMAYMANMSKRNFQRRFSEQVGISPKLFNSLVRFNHAFALKLGHPDMNWTSIAFECGYFDQTHLVKDFKRFSGDTPSDFLKQTPLTGEHYNSRIIG